jgi:hypothetical protein
VQNCFELSIAHNFSSGVENLPRKEKKKAARVERTAVCILCCKGNSGCKEFFIVQRPASGSFGFHHGFIAHGISMV